MIFFEGQRKTILLSKELATGKALPKELRTNLKIQNLLLHRQIIEIRNSLHFWYYYSFFLGGWFIFHNLNTKIPSPANGIELTKKTDNIFHRPEIKNTNSNISTDKGTFTNFSRKNKSANYKKGMIPYSGNNSNKVRTRISNAFYFENNIETTNERSFNNDLVIKKQDNYNNHFPANSDNTTPEISEQGDAGNRDSTATILANEMDKDHNSLSLKTRKKKHTSSCRKKRVHMPAWQGVQILARWNQDHLIRRALLLV